MTAYSLEEFFAWLQNIAPIDHCFALHMSFGNHLPDHYEFWSTLIASDLSSQQNEQTSPAILK